MVYSQNLMRPTDRKQSNRGLFCARAEQGGIRAASPQTFDHPLPTRPCRRCPWRASRGPRRSRCAARGFRKHSMPTALNGFSGCLDLVAKRAQALPVPVVVLSALPKRNDVVQLEGARCPRRDVHKPATVGTVRPIPEPYPEPGFLPRSAAGPGRRTDPLRLRQRDNPHHLHPNRCCSYSWSDAHKKSHLRVASNQISQACVLSSTCFHTTFIRAA